MCGTTCFLTCFNILVVGQGATTSMVVARVVDVAGHIILKMLLKIAIVRLASRAGCYRV
jgi:hypothetical protein